MRIEDHEIPQRNSFCYLESIINNDVEIDEDVKNRIKEKLLKWRLASKVLCNQQMPTRLMENFYRTTIRLATTYGAEC